MVELVEITTVFLVTLLALATASALHWMLLRAAFRLIEPATARPNLPSVRATPAAVPVAAAHRR